LRNAVWTGELRDPFSVQPHRNRRVAAGHYGCREETAGNTTTKTVGENVSQHSAQGKRSSGPLSTAGL